MNTGLVSVTFRQLSCEEIIKYACNSGLKYIEWGSDVHVPETYLENAKRIADLTHESGLSVSSYGSYYYLGEGQNFRDYLDTARILKAPVIRVWAGKTASAAADGCFRNKLAHEAKEIAKQASEFNINVDFEYHPNTLTDEHTSARRLLEEINEPNCRIYWQPNFDLSHEENLDAINDVLDFVDIVHVFSWEPKFVRLPLADRASLWNDYMRILKRKKDIKYLLEFVPDDNPEILKRESETLRNFLKGSN